MIPKGYNAIQYAIFFSTPFPLLLNQELSNLAKLRLLAPRLLAIYTQVFMLVILSILYCQRNYILA